MEEEAVVEVNVTGENGEVVGLEALDDCLEGEEVFCLPV